MLECNEAVSGEATKAVSLQQRPICRWSLRFARWIFDLHSAISDIAEALSSIASDILANAASEGPKVLERRRLDTLSTAESGQAQTCCDSQPVGVAWSFQFEVDIGRW